KLAPGRALDLACGTGRNAVWLAGAGWEVTAVDRSEKAIETLRNRGVSTVVADLEEHEFAIEPDALGLILMCLYLQPDLFEPAKCSLKPGGALIAIVHLSEPGRISRYSLDPGELRRYFEGWEILHDHEGPSSDPEHQRPVAEIVARKPSPLTRHKPAT